MLVNISLSCCILGLYRLTAERRAQSRMFESPNDAAMEFAARLGLRPLEPPAPRRASLIDDLVLEYASPRTQRLLKEYDAQSQV